MTVAPPRRLAGVPDRAGAQAAEWRWATPARPASAWRPEGSRRRRRAGRGDRWRRCARRRGPGRGVAGGRAGPARAGRRAAPVLGAGGAARGPPGRGRPRRTQRRQSPPQRRHSRARCWSAWGWYLFTVFGVSATRSVDEAVTRSFAGDLALTPAPGGLGIAPDGGPDRRAARGGRGRRGGSRPAVLAGRQDELAFADLAALGDVLDLDVAEGDLVGAVQGGLAVSTSYAEERGWRQGDTVTVGLPGPHSAWNWPPPTRTSRWSVRLWSIGPRGLPTRANPGSPSSNSPRHAPG